MKNYDHLNREQRDTIQYLINQNKNFTYIGKSISKDRTVISKEIRRNRYIKSNRYEPFDKEAINTAVSKCKKLSSPPYVCNNCDRKSSCPLHHLFYNSKLAQENYERVLSESRQGVNITPERVDEIENIIVPLIKDQKQSVNQVYINHSDILDFCKVSFYNYVNQGVFSLTNLDLPKKVRYKKRKQNNKKYKRDVLILKGRKYEDFLDFRVKHPSMNIVQLDTVIGMRTNKKTLLTMYLVDTHFMLIFLLDNKTSQAVTQLFKALKDILSIDVYRKVYRIIVTDNGPEFYNPYEMEYDYSISKKVANAFYCHPNASYEKHELEVNHEYIRRVFPKGTNFSSLKSSQVKRLQDNINAIPRLSLNGKTPYDLTLKKYPELIKKLNCSYIKPDDVTLNPKDILEDENE